MVCVRLSQDLRLSSKGGCWSDNSELVTVEGGSAIKLCEGPAWAGSYRAGEHELPLSPSVDIEGCVSFIRPLVLAAIPVGINVSLGLLTLDLDPGGRPLPRGCVCSAWLEVDVFLVLLFLFITKIFISEISLFILASDGLAGGYLDSMSAFLFKCPASYLKSYSKSVNLNSHLINLCPGSFLLCMKFIGSWSLTSENLLPNK